MIRLNHKVPTIDVGVESLTSIHYSQQFSFKVCIAALCLYMTLLANATCLLCWSSIAPSPLDDASTWIVVCLFSFELD